MAVAYTPIPARAPARRVRQASLAALTPIVCAALALVGLSLALVPQAAWLELPRPLVIWSTALGLFGLSIACYHAARVAGHSPWIAPISLLGITYFMRFGWGTLVTQYCEDYPWVHFPRYRWLFHAYGVWQYLPGGCQLILVFGIGMTIGGFLALSKNTSMLPRFSWSFSDETLKRRAMLYAPFAACINLAQFVLPVSIKFLIGLFGGFIYPLIMVGAYYLFHAQNAKERAQWMTFLVASVGFTMPVGLITGQVNGLMMPFVCIFLGYTVARGAPPWKLVAVVLPVMCLVLLPFFSLYKWAGGWTKDVGQRLEATINRYSDIGYRGRFELTLERTVIRFAGANHPSLY